jgi:hypothetical protein
MIDHHAAGLILPVPELSRASPQVVPQLALPWLHVRVRLVVVHAQRLQRR